MKRRHSRGFWRLMFELEKRVTATAFWRHSPVELLARIDAGADQPITRQRLRDLQDAFPDRDPEAGAF